MAEASQDAAKRLAAARALDYVSAGMKLGLGTGTTAAFFVDALGARVSAGFDVVGVPTSERTRDQAARLGIPLTTLDETPELDLTIDGADEFDAALRLIKGGGGAHLREKIVAASSKRMIVIADRSKYVARLGRFPLPVEIVSFGQRSTLARLAAAAEDCGCHGAIKLRQNDDGHAFVTDSGNAIADCSFGAIPDPEALAAALGAVPGIVEHGLFIGMATAIIVAGAGTDDIEILGHPDR